MKKRRETITEKGPKCLFDGKTMVAGTFMKSPIWYCDWCDGLIKRPTPRIKAAIRASRRSES